MNEIKIFLKNEEEGHKQSKTRGKKEPDRSKEKKGEGKVETNEGRNKRTNKEAS